AAENQPSLAGSGAGRGLGGAAAGLGWLAAAGAGRFAAFGAAGAFRIVSAMRFLARSTSTMVTWTRCCTLTTSLGSLTKRSASWLMWTRPSWWTPMSTNAPKAVTLVTRPGSFMPG